MLQNNGGGWAYLYMQILGSHPRTTEFVFVIRAQGSLSPYTLAYLRTTLRDSDATSATGPPGQKQLSGGWNSGSSPSFLEPFFSKILY